ncbi:MAG: assimilatory sulfite reductase (NADPH) flavoprotein subunit [Gammaproteobacteria bacterium]|nr:assimilatory sulfite reductase (NADPH) flavoprotein subunit [Gammaproteobacteria bacterium]MDH3408069.1 assimilatory sulfite reductase (NADPH) flavoprotein subunit [Gammaproteobacteria bacterium]
MSTLAAGSIALPLDNEQLAQLHQVVAGLSAGQLQWVSGYTAGLAAADIAPLVPVTEPGNGLTILYGSQTGNGQEIAEKLADQARTKGFATTLKSLAEFKHTSLKREKLVTFVISTHGEGDPPDDAELFHEFILSSQAPKLPNLRYFVLALGDSSYVNYCQTGRELDARLAELGAERLETLVECDLDYEDAARDWSTKVLQKLPELLQAGKAAPHLRAIAGTSMYDKQRPFPAKVLVNQKITGAASSKDVRHIELSLEGSGLKYEPGDALAVIVENPPQLVEQFLSEFGFAATSVVTVGEEETTIEDALSRRLEITVPNLGFLRVWSEHSHAAELQELMRPGHQAELSAFMDSHQIIDIIRKYPATLRVEEFASSLRKLSARSYSIASSQTANPDEVHLTVAALRYNAFDTEHWGAASTHIADRISEGDTLSVYVEPNPRFRLPENDKPIIMIGPGTGVAPFRAFVEERAERDASGKNWLIFGDRNFSSDFLYQLEWQRYLTQGRLHRLDVAFSRDQDEKLYVQQRIRENGAEIYSWLEGGAVIYVCGDAKQMAGDVDRALAEVIAIQSNISTSDANLHLKELRREGRYQRDVY